MSRKLVLFAAVPFLFAGPVLAQSADQAPAGSDTEAPPPPAATDTMTPDAPMPGTAVDSGTATDDTANAPDAGSPESDTAPAAGTDQVQILTEEGSDQVLAADIIGMDVVDASGNKIGKVDDVVIGSDGRVTGLVLSAGEILGLGGKTVGVSWSDIGAAVNADSLTVNISEEQLTAAPEFRSKEDQMREQTENAPPSPDQMAPAAGGATTTQ